MQCESWCSLSDDELARRDIAEVNLAAAFDLPQARNLDIPSLCRRVDDWARIVREATQKALPRRTRELCLRKYSEAQFRILAMVTVLQRDLGLRYNLAFMEGEYDGSDSRNLFIHGPLSGHGYNCVTMPVLYAAVGRRLGYPIELVLAKEHTFCRWDGETGDRFRSKASSLGFTCGRTNFTTHGPTHYAGKNQAGVVSAKPFSAGRISTLSRPTRELLY